MSTNEAPQDDTADDTADDADVDPIDTALNSCRRSRNKAAKAGDKKVAKIMLMAESQLIQLMAERMGQEEIPGVEAKA